MIKWNDLQTKIRQTGRPDGDFEQRMREIRIRIREVRICIHQLLSR